MTNQEAISVLESIDAKTDYFLINDDARAEAIDMAISALQVQDLQPTCNNLATDTISRQAAIDVLDAYQVMVENGEENPYAWARLRMSELPSAQPEQRWIPCSETVDIPDHEVLCCDRYGEELIGWLSYNDDQWLCESDGEMMYDPIAWREKPEPYRAERRTDELGNI